MCVAYDLARGSPRFRCWPGFCLGRRLIFSELAWLLWFRMLALSQGFVWAGLSSDRVKASARGMGICWWGEERHLELCWASTGGVRGCLTWGSGCWPSLCRVGSFLQRCGWKMFTEVLWNDFRVNVCLVEHNLVLILKLHKVTYFTFPYVFVILFKL